MRAERRPVRSTCRLSFVLRSYEKVMRISRQFLDVADILHWRFYVKEYRLIIRVHGIKRLICGYGRIDFRGGLFHLLPVFQNDCRERIATCTDRDAQAYENRDNYCPV